MADNPDQVKVIELLFQQGMLTQDQVRRIYLALHSGKDLGWALSHVPLVEHLNFVRAQSAAGSATATSTTGLTPIPVRAVRGATPTPLPGRAARPATPTPRPVRPITEIYEVKPITAGAKDAFIDAATDPSMGPQAPGDLDPGADNVPTLELDDIDYRTGFEEMVKPMAASGPTEEIQVEPFTPPLTDSTPTPRPVSRANPEAYLRPGIVPPVYDLAEDEGIPLVNRVNGLLAEALEEGAREVIIRPVAGGVEVVAVTELGTEGQARRLAAEEGAKILNRLKIMSRIEPWRRAPQRGAFFVLQAKRQSRVLIDVTTRPDKPGEESIRLQLLPAR